MQNKMQSELVTFKVDGIKRFGIKVGDYLAVAKPYRDKAKTFLIYVLCPGGHSGLIGRKYSPEFSEEEEAIAFAVLLNTTYSQWLPLLEDYFNMDIIEVSKWSVGYDFTRNCYVNHSGLRLAEAWEKFCKLNPPVNLSSFRILYEQTQA